MYPGDGRLPPAAWLLLESSSTIASEITRLVYAVKKCLSWLGEKYSG